MFNLIFLKDYIKNEFKFKFHKYNINYEFLFSHIRNWDKYYFYLLQHEQGKFKINNKTTMQYLISIILERCSLFMERSAEFLMINIKNIKYYLYDPIWKEKKSWYLMIIHQSRKFELGQDLIASSITDIRLSRSVSETDFYVYILLLLKLCISMNILFSSWRF